MQKNAFSQFKIRTLTRDLAIGLVLIVTSILVLIGAVIYFVSVTQMKQDLALQSRSMADKLAYILSIPVWTLDTATVEKIADAYKDAESVAGIRVLDQDGYVLYDQPATESRLIKASKPIRYGNELIGSVEVSISTESITRVSRNILLVTLAAVLSVVIAVLISTSFLLRKFLDRPLAELTRGINSIASGNYSHKLMRAPQAEIDGIVQRVNDMASQIAEREVALRQSEERFRQVVTSISDHVYVMEITASGEWINRYKSPRLESMVGYPTERYTNDGRFWLNTIVYPPDLPNALEQISRLAKGENSEIEYRLIRHDGEIIWIRDSARVEQSVSSKFVYGLISNITERKKTENTLYFLAQRGWAENGEDFFTALARYLGETLSIDYVFINQVDQAGKIARTLANYWLGEIRPNFEYPLSDTPCENIYGNKLCTYAMHVQQSFPHDPILTDMGAESYSGIPLWDSRGNSVGLIALVHRQPLQNIHLIESLLQLVAEHAGHEIERMEAELALREERDRAQNYLDTVEALIVVLDIKGEITLINRMGCRLLGYEEVELLGKSWFEICLPAPDGLEVVFPMFLKMILGEVNVMEYNENSIVTRNGELRQIAWHNTILRNQQGQITGTLSAGEDITARKQAEEEIRKFNANLEQRVAERTAQLEAANKELESFSYSISHDLRAPLRSIDGYSRLLLDDPGSQISEDGRQMLDHVRVSARRMGTLIDDLLRFSRLGRQHVIMQTVNISKIVDDALQVLQSEQNERQVQILIHELPTCQGDPSLLMQVWVNLLSNALKYTRTNADARIEIGCQVGENGENVYFIRDNGVGFDMDTADKLFGVFQRLHSDNEFEGTGVGLALTQRIINRHGGRIWAEAKKGSGATFYFTVG